MEDDPSRTGPKGEQKNINQVMVKVGWIGILILVLLIPLSMIGSTLGERQKRNQEAVADISSSWGNAQTIVGPVLRVPYDYSYKTFKDTIVKGEVRKIEVIETATAHAFFFPDKISVTGELQPERLHRGIYEAVVYRGSLRLEGRFPAPDFRSLDIDPERVDWKNSTVSVAVSDLRGTVEELQFKIGGDRFRMVPGTGLSGFPSGVHARIGDLGKIDKSLPFSMDIALKGSGSVNFAPIGIENAVSLTSPWPDPSFNGRFLPTERSVSAEGFKALWEISYYGREYPQSFKTAFPGDKIQNSLFGVSFYNAVDSYRMVERAIKYGVLFLTLVFAVFFIYETLAALKIHVIQYVLVGAAMCLFYLGLLSFSEFIPFGWAYLLASTAAGLMITLYSASVLKSGARSLMIGGELAAIYTFLYVTLQLHDYSLLLGSVGLFGVLSSIMYLTRHLDWHAHDRR